MPRQRRRCLLEGKERLVSKVGTDTLNQEHEPCKHVGEDPNSSRLRILRLSSFFSQSLEPVRLRFRILLAIQFVARLACGVHLLHQSVNLDRVNFLL